MALIRLNLRYDPEGTYECIEPLDANMAYYKGSPIRSIEDIKGLTSIAEHYDKLVITRPIDPDWKESLKDKVWATNYTGTEELEHGLVKLRAKLLTLGGEEVCMPFAEEDLKPLMTRGQIWFGDRTKMAKGLDSRCHENSCLCWEKNPDMVRIATGYALTGDGLWRQHSWCVWQKPRKNMIVETTERRILYFGYVMTYEECQEFAYYNT